MLNLLKSMKSYLKRNVTIQFLRGWDITIRQIRSYTSAKASATRKAPWAIFFLMVIFPLLLSGQGNIIFHENFDYPDNTMPAHWWSEGVPAYIRNGRMFVDADATAPGVSTIWLDKEFSGNLSIEFDVHIVSSTNLDNNLNFFLFYSHPDGGALRDTKEERADGNYNRYHKLNGYIFTHLANGTEVPARFRFRYNPGFQLLEELFAYECKRETTYRIKIVRNGSLIQYWADGKLIINTEIDEGLIHKKGLIGFRTFRTSLWWDNLVVRQMD